MKQLTSRESLTEVHQRILRIVSKKKLAHAYLLAGKKGSNLKEMALFFAQTIFCEQKKAEEIPCQSCSQCKRIENRNHPDVHLIEPENQVIKIEQIRLLQKEFAYRGVEQEKKIYIIHHVDTMTTQASNSLLKFLEEPYPGTTALLLTEQRHRLLPTILSRCLEIPLPPPSIEDMTALLAQQVPIDIARLATHLESGEEEAHNLCQSDWFAEMRPLVIQLTEEINKPLTKELLILIDNWAKLNRDKSSHDLALDMLLLWCKDLLYVKLNLQDKLVYTIEKERIKKQALYLTEGKIAGRIDVVLQAKRRLQANVNPGLLLDQLVLRLREV
jgi:DNA polymerase-3 subunit delta'